MGLIPEELHHGDVLASVRRGPGLELRLVFEVTRQGHPSVALELRTPKMRGDWSRWRAIGAIRIHEITILLDAFDRARSAITGSRWSSTVRGETQRKLDL